MKTFDVYICSTTLIHELGQGDPGPWKFYLNPEDIKCCQEEINGKHFCKPVKVTLSWDK